MGIAARDTSKSESWVMIQSWPERILSSYQLMGSRTTEMTRVFYDRLFELRPETRSLFTIDMEMQRQHLAASLALIVRNLRTLDVLEESLRELGANHARVGVRPEHYPLVRDCMLFAFAETLGDAWTNELRDDWTRLLDVIASHMLAGAANELR
jgi:hemoglobin-like flavoprotein